MDTSGKEDILVLRSEFRDEFEGKLIDVIGFLTSHGLDSEDAYRITAIVGELGNNAFDHNLGRWPTDFVGCLAAIRRLPKEKNLEIVVTDLGAGFQASLANIDHPPHSETDAIELAISGVTGRVGEKRGNGLRTILTWMREYYKGRMRLQSGGGIVTIENGTIESADEQKIQGVEVYLTLSYDDKSK